MGQKRFTQFAFQLSGLLSSLCLIMMLVCIGTKSTQAQISVAANATNVTCSGGSDGSITAQVFGGWPPYTYIWSNGETTETISGLPAGTYTVTVQDKDLAIGIATATVFEPAPLGIILQPSTTCGTSGGSIQSIVFQGTPPYTYVWSNGQTTANATGLTTGTYTLTVTDNNGCTAVESADVGTGAGLNLFTTASYETCTGSNDATATVVALSGTAPFTYLWSDGQTTDIAIGLAAGSYGVTVTDATGCTGETTQVVELSPEGVWIMITSMDAFCGQNNGTAHVSAMTGQPPYTYLWSNGDMTADPTGLGTGTYTVTVTDANGCSAVGSTDVGSTPAPDPGSISTTDPTTFCVTDTIPDIITVTSTGNTAPNFRFVITDANGIILGINTTGIFDLTSAPVGTCLIWGLGWEGTITGADVGSDANLITGCYALTDPITVVRTDCQDPCVANAGTLTGTPDACLAAGGSVTLTTTPDGNAVVPAGYQTLYVLTSGSGLVIQATNTTPSFTVTASGMYTIHTLVYDPTTLDLSIVVPGTTTGFDVNALLIQGGGNICAALDVNGAKTTVTDAPDVSITPADASICAGSSVILTANSSVSNLMYEWTATGGSFNNPNFESTTYTMMTPGTYTITVKVMDMNGCSSMAMTTVTVTSNPDVTISPSAPSVCKGESVDFSAMLTGGTAPFTYAWTASGGSFNDATSATPTYTMMMPGTYTITVNVTDANGCEGTGTTEVTINDTPTVSISPENTSVCKGETVDFTSTVSGGTSPYTYAWTATGGSFSDATAADPTYTMMMPGTYTITLEVTDANGCSATSSTEVTINDTPEVDIMPTDAKICKGESLQINANASGGTPPYTYMWTATGGSFDDAASASPTYMMMMNGTYTLTVKVTDANGCETTGSTTVTVEAPDAGTLTIDADPVCLENGKATLSATPNGDAFVPAGYETIFVLTSGPGLVIEQVNAAPSFMVMATGDYTIHTLVYDPTTLDLSIVVFGTTTGFDVNSLLVQGGGSICASLDVTGAPVSVFKRDIGDYVWIDENWDGFQNSFEKGFEGATVKLLTAGPDSVFCTPDDVIEGMDTTDANGFYLFQCVLPGEYIVSFEINNPDYTFTKKDATLLDEKDSDVDTLSGKTDPFTITPADGDDLTIDAGVHLICVNYTYPGRIAASQTICIGSQPDLLISLAEPTGGFGPIEYLWMYSTQDPPPADISLYTPYPNSNSPDFQPGPIFEKTFIRRCARSIYCTDYIEPDEVIIDVVDCPMATMQVTANALFNGQVELNWDVFDADEQYNYYIQRRNPKNLQFETIDMISGAWPNGQILSYEFIDQTPHNGRNFYRIKQVGVNGVSLSDILEVSVGLESMKQVLTYPNPAYNEVIIKPVNPVKGEQAVMHIYNMHGQLIQTHQLDADQNKYGIDVKALPDGAYILRIQYENGEIRTTRILKQDH